MNSTTVLFAFSFAVSRTDNGMIASALQLPRRERRCLALPPSDGPRVLSSTKLWQALRSPTEGNEPCSDDDASSHTFSYSQNPRIRALYTREQQLWLDLRRTAVLPHEASQILDSQLGLAGGTPPQRFFDGVLVAASSIERIREHTTSPHQDEDYWILSPTGDTTASDASNNMPLVLFDRTASNSYDIGVCSDDLDPQLALQTVVDDQNWLLLDSPPDSGGLEEDDITNLLHLLSSAPSLEAASPGELLLPKRDAGQGTNTPSGDTTAVADVPPPPLRGGVAIVCRDFPSFVSLDAAVAALQYGTTTTTATGLLVAGSSRVTMASAIVLPLDLSIWRSVLQIRGMR